MNLPCPACQVTVNIGDVIKDKYNYLEGRKYLGGREHYYIEPKSRSEFGRHFCFSNNVKIIQIFSLRDIMSYKKHDGWYFRDIKYRMFNEFEYLKRHQLEFLSKILIPMEDILWKWELWNKDIIKFKAAPVITEINKDPIDVKVTKYCRDKRSEETINWEQLFKYLDVTTISRSVI